MKEEERIKHIFARDSQSKGLAIWFPIIVTVFIFIVLTIALVSANIVKVNPTDNNQERVLTFEYFILGFVLSVLCNFISSFFWDKWLKYWWKRNEQTKMEQLRGIADTEIMTSALYELSKYNNIRFKDYRIDASLSKSITQGFLNCSVTTSYIKNIVNNELVFRFIRIRNDQEADEADPVEDDDKAEYVYRSDERSFRHNQNGLDETFYRLTYLEINHKRVEVPKPIVSRNIIEYKFLLDSSYVSKDISLKFTAEYIVEFDSFTTFYLKYPTHNIDFNFDFSRVKEEIDFYSYSFVNNKDRFSKLHKKGDPYHSYRLYDYWCLPSSNFLCIWYKK